MTLLLAVFAGLLIVGTPIAMAMIASAGLVIWLEGIPLTIVAQRVYAGLQSFPLLAIPLFILAGSLMNETGIGERLFGFTGVVAYRGGWRRRSGRHVFLSGISGSSLADCAATTRVLVPRSSRVAMAGVCRRITASSATLGPIIPPSPDGALRLAGECLAGALS